MKIGITGASGLVGEAWTKSARAAGHEVVRFVRHETTAPDEVTWNPKEKKVQKGAFLGLDGMVHLAGENIASGRWTEEKKERIRNSRTVGTQTLVQAAIAEGTVPKFWVQASAIGYYGGRGQESLTEASSMGEGFLAEVCEEWEAAARPIEQVGSRLTICRIGMVLSKKGGALAKMLTPFKFGVGGKISDGEQWMSWVSLRDLVSILMWAAQNENANGVYNAVSPNPVNNETFTKTLGKVLKRPTILPAPAFALKILLGEMAENLLLSGAKVFPKRLIDAGFDFQDADLKTFLEDEL